MKADRQKNPGPIADWAIDPDGHHVFVDPLNHRLWVVDDGRRFKPVGCEGSGPGQFRYPSGVVLTQGRAYVVDSWNHRVQAFDQTTWRWRFEFGGFGKAAGQLFCPSGITVFGEWLVVADRNNERLSFHRKDGRFDFHRELTGFPLRVSVRNDRLWVRYEDRGWEHLAW